MSIKISELPQANTVNNTDVIPIVQGGTTKKAPAGLIHPTIATTIDSTSTNNEVAGAKAVYDYCANLNDTVTLKYTDYNGTGKTISNTKVALATGNFTISGGTYLVISQPVIMSFSTSNYQFNLGITIDTTDTSIYSVAKLNNVGGGTATTGNFNIAGLIDLPQGTHTLTLYGATNNSSKTATIPAYREL